MRPFDYHRGTGIEDATRAAVQGSFIAGAPTSST